MNQNYRRAALTLSALSKRDRRWILDNLEVEERRQLEEALRDLGRNGLRLQSTEFSALLEEPMDVSEDTSASENQPSRAKAGERVAGDGASGQARDPSVNGTLRRDAEFDSLTNARGTDVFYLFSNEPDWLIAAVCLIANWPWQMEFLALMGNVRAARIRRYVNQHRALKPALRSALVAAVARCLTHKRETVGFTVAMDDANRPNERIKSGLVARVQSWLL